MKYALNDGNKVEASKGAKGFCPSCGSELIAKCGEVNVNHWAHKGNRNCDSWWENETDWHRSWKDKFPMDWQEVVHFANSGEKHIADVKTESGWILEFQHSYLKPDERLSRNAFYGKLVWVVDGLRRKRDKEQFQNKLKECSVVNKNPLICRVSFPDECKILKEWLRCNAFVFLDFQETKAVNQSDLWFLFPQITNNEVFISPFSRPKFIEMHNENKFDEMVNNIILPIHKELVKGIQVQQKINSRGIPIPNRLPMVKRYRVPMRRRRRRF